MEITPHVAQNDTNRRSAVDERTTRHGGTKSVRRKRKRIEEVFGWMKSVGLSASYDIVDWNASNGCSPSRQRLQFGAHPQPNARCPTARSVE